MSSLVTLYAEYEAILATIKENDGEISPETETQLAMNLIESKHKVSGYAFMLDHFQSEIDFMKDQIAKANAYCKTIEAQKEKLETIALQVAIAKGSRLEGDNGRWISTRKSKSLEITDKDQIPAIFTKISVAIDNKAVKDALLAGEDVPGAKINENINISWK